MFKNVSYTAYGVAINGFTCFLGFYLSVYTEFLEKVLIAKYFGEIQIILAVFTVSLTLFYDFKNALFQHRLKIHRADHDGTKLFVVDPEIGLQMMTERLKRSKVVFNTRFLIPSDGKHGDSVKAMDKWRQAVLAHVKNSNTNFSEIIADDDDQVKEAKNLLEKMSAHSYMVRKLKKKENFYRNFTIFIFDDEKESREIWWGWGQRKASPLKCYYTRNQKYISDYIGRYDSLFDDNDLVEEITTE